MIRWCMLGMAWLSVWAATMHGNQLTSNSADSWMHICQLPYPATCCWYGPTEAQSNTLLLAGLALWAVLAHRKRPYSELMGSLPGSLPGTDVSSKRGGASNAPSSPAFTSCDPSSPRQSWEEMRRAQSETGSAPQRYNLGETPCNASVATSPGFCLSRKKRKGKTTPSGANSMRSLVIYQAAQVMPQHLQGTACVFICLLIHVLL